MKLNAERLRYYLGRILIRLSGLRKKHSYSMLNEDNVLDWLTGYKDKGTYIDIGAFDPNRISNTRLFYERGWTGINIEPNALAVQAFKKYRPRDINLSTGVGVGTLTYYGNDGRAGNTFNKEEAIKYGLKPISEIKLTPLREIFEKNILIRVDFMTVDVEEFEEEALSTNDWDKYRADVICLEGHSHPYLKKWGYKWVFYDGGNSYYRSVR